MPFTQQEFFEVFVRYNTAVFPLQLLLHVSGFFVLAMMTFASARPGALRVRQAVAAMLALLWFWMGFVYHVGFFSGINPAAFAFGIVFVVQGVIFAVMAWRASLEWLHPSLWRQTAGGLFLLYGLIFYPMLNGWLGHEYLASPSFGAPCPTVVFTFGVLLMAKHVHWAVWIIPLLWSAIGGSAAFLLGVPQDYGLVAAGLAGLAAVLSSRAGQA